MTIEPPPERGRRRRRAKLRPGGIVAIVLAVVLNLVVFGVAGWILLNPQRAVDHWVVFTYEASPTIERYADRSGMSDDGRFLLYASVPVVSAGDDFDDICSSHSEEFGVLGCYLFADKTIHLFDVTDDRLDGIEEVVAAHEMLHAAWDRTPLDQRRSLEALLDAEAAKLADDPRFSETIEFYAEAEPGQRYNELHSIVGTEFPEISAELEEYYAKFFDDRAAVTTLHAASDAVFEQQREQIETTVARAEELRSSIETDYATYNAGYESLDAEISIFNSRAQTGYFATESAFNGERDALLARQSELDGLYASIESRVTEHEQLLGQLDALNAQVDELNESINITPRDGGL